MFDFENDDWPDGMRITYKMAKWCFLDAAYDYCRHVLKTMNAPKDRAGHRDNWSINESEYGYAYEQCEGLFRSPIELLMYEVIALVCDGGRGAKEFKDYHHSKIAELLKNNDLESMLALLPETERNDFEGDLKLFNLI